MEYDSRGSYQEPLSYPNEELLESDFALESLLPLVTLVGLRGTKRFSFG